MQKISENETQKTMKFKYLGEIIIMRLRRKKNKTGNRMTADVRYIQQGRLSQLQN